MATTAGLVSPRASASSISDLRAKAADIAATIQRLGQQEEALSENYDQAELGVQGLEAQVAAAARQLAKTQAAVAKSRTVLEQDAVEAYVDGGESAANVASNPLQNASETLLRAEYADTFAASGADAIDQYHLMTLQQQAAEVNLRHETAAAKHQLAKVVQAEQAVQNMQSQLQAQESEATGELAVLVAQQQAAEQAAAAAAAQQRLEAEQQAAAAAAAAAQTVSSAPAPVAETPTLSPPPPVGSGAAGAVRAAESRVGDWYQWGAAGPDTFDCSGLVMWAYEQVGVSLPHFSGAQYADTTHIPMSDLEPGDLVFPADPGQHVAMYVGGGMIVEAPHTGAQVHIVPMGSWFVLASRVE